MAKFNISVITSKTCVRVLSISGLICGLSACGGDDANPAQGDTLNDYAQLNLTHVRAQTLTPATTASLERHLKNGVRLNVRANTLGYQNNDVVVMPTLIGDSGGQSEFSPTNTHVRGVDEADFVKYDGQYIYMISEPEYIWGQASPDAAIRILQTAPANASVQELASIPINNEVWGEVSGLYLAGSGTTSETLVSLRSTWSFITASEPSLSNPFFTSFPIPYQDKIQLNFYDISDPSMPEERFNIEIDGYLHASRKIDNTVYLLTQFSPHLPMINFYLADQEQALRNEEKISELSLNDLLPKVSLNGGDEAPLLAAEDCLLPADTDANSGYLNLVALVAIDLNTRHIKSAKCLNAAVQGVYVNGENLYLGASKTRENSADESVTVVHKFGLEEEIRYRATGVVPGSIGWADPAFRMDEYNDNLRIVTTEATGESDPIHRLFILQESATEHNLSIIASLPNETHPSAIGKPGEDIFAVRFMQERAYVVTFERVDPLYVFDLSDPTRPSIAGELEVPGFSTYLHPLGDNYLLALGNETDETGVGIGLKLALFDVSDINAPSLVGNELIGNRGTWSNALYDLRALSFLSPNDNQLRVSFPVSTYSAYAWKEESLYLMEVNGLESANAQLRRVGRITAETHLNGRDHPRFSGTGRSVLHDDAVYYIHGNSVWSSFWSSPNNASGPH